MDLTILESYQLSFPSSADTIATFHPLYQKKYPFPNPDSGTNSPFKYYNSFITKKQREKSPSISIPNSSSISETTSTKPPTSKY